MIRLALLLAAIVAVGVGVPRLAGVLWLRQSERDARWWEDRA
jgi:hypothetical protein